jgi:hypothetical protein
MTGARKTGQNLDTHDVASAQIHTFFLDLNIK